MAWNSKSGSLNSSSISDDEYWSLFNFVFSESCHKTSTYKFALLKSILDNLLNNTPDENGQLIFIPTCSQNSPKAFGILS